MKKILNLRQLKFHLAIVAIVSTVSCTTQETKESGVSISSLLNEMIDRDAITKFPTKDFRLNQESSYNRASKTPNDTVGWFTNQDFNRKNKEEDQNFIRTEEINGQKEWVLMDHQGPGAIVRTWMPFLNAQKPTTTSTIKIYLDGAKEPTLQGNMLGLLNGTGLFPFPFAHKSLRSAVSFFPIPYAKSCKITVTEKPFFYQFTYREYDEGTKIKTFTLKDFKEENTLVKKVGDALLAPEKITEGKHFTLSETLNTGEEKSVELTSGTNAVRGLSLKLDSYKDSTVTRSVVLKIEFDGQETVWSPIGDFFGSGIGLNPFQGWYRTVANDGTMSSRWVMPYQKNGRISVVNLGSNPIDVKLEAVVGDYTWDENSMYFNAAWRGEYPVSTRPFSDWNYVTLKGRGVYVGDALTIWNPVKRWWGEGDEKIWVDGEDFPSIFGTGTEDYYGYSWGGMSNDFYEHPFHAQPNSNKYNKHNRKTEAEIGDRNTQKYSTETRTRALDGMPFGSSLQLDMEIWSWTKCDMEYGVGVYWYGDAATKSNCKADPEAVKDLLGATKIIIEE
ncbi:glycoside hydrolase family 172 protein [Zobellia alginiliquefaciens]|uniref:glycoside hydrolase family 172 protein n=1 Tax=Zobellia alginiliquefaciens TaxID=3032586 RepID=UPI0023E3674E|nr:glycoside hydrolase family 172 protein [Zobellia alginiliquefaciens]